MSYHHTHVGVHEVPIIYEANVPGQNRFPLLWRGATVNEHGQLETDQAVRIEAWMQPVCIASKYHEHMIQQVEIKNFAQERCAYSLDLADFHAVNARHYGFPIFTFMDELEGTLEAGEVRIAHIMFRPIQARVYKAFLGFKIKDGITYEIRIIGVGILPTSPLMPTPYLKANPAYCSADATIALSESHLYFGVVDGDGRHEAVVTLYNRSSAPIKYEWATQAISFTRDAVKVSPAKGTLLAGKAMHFRLHYMLDGMCLPRHAWADIFCQVTSPLEPDTKQSTFFIFSPW